MMTCNCKYQTTLKRFWKRLLLLIGLPLWGQAANLGTWGDLWPVQEQSFLAFIHDRLQWMQDHGELAALLQQLQQQTEIHILRPAPVDGLQTDTIAHTTWYDPTFVARRDVADAQGHLIIHKGDRINPLDVLSLATVLYFIDGDDKRQIAWMKSQKPTTLTYKIILVNGNVRNVADSLSERIYFDQQGVLSHKLGLRYIPAVVQQEGRRLKITSIAMPQTD